MPRAKQRTQQLRDHVLQVAVEVLANEGIAGFTTRKVAREADTSTPALYELFGDKAGLVREVFFEGFRLLRRYLDRVEPSGDPRADLVRLVGVYRTFVQQNPVLSQVIFSRPFADFDPEPAEIEAGRSVREFIVEHVRRCVDAGLLVGDVTDIAHVLVSLTQGLASAEVSRRLGSSPESVDRRWTVGIEAVLDGLSPAAHRPARPRVSPGRPAVAG